MKMSVVLGEEPKTQAVVRNEGNGKRKQCRDCINNISGSGQKKRKDCKDYICKNYVWKLSMNSFVARLPLLNINQTSFFRVHLYLYPSLQRLRRKAEFQI